MRVIVESPFSGGKPEYITYAWDAMHDSLMRGESPFLSHLLYTQVLDDRKPSERELGMQAAFKWYAAADYVVVYEDMGITSGMEKGIGVALLSSVPVWYRKIR